MKIALRVVLGLALLGLFGNGVCGRGVASEQDQSALLNAIAALPAVHHSATPVENFEVFGGSWKLTEEVDGGVVDAAASLGGRLVPTDERFVGMKSGEIQAELFIAERKAGFSGLNFKVSDNGVGADAFNGCLLYTSEAETVGWRSTELSIL